MQARRPRMAAIPKRPNHHTYRQIPAGEIAVSEIKQGDKTEAPSSATNTATAPSGCGSAPLSAPRPAALPSAMPWRWGTRSAAVSEQYLADFLGWPRTAGANSAFSGVQSGGHPQNLWVRLWVLLANPFRPVSDWPPLLRFWGPDKKKAAFPKEKRLFDHPKMVGATGFEPATSWSRTKRSTRLSHAPC